MTDIVGIKVKLDRNCDRENPCCTNVAIVGPGKAQHAGEFRCADCGAHRGWLAQATQDFICTTVRRFGAPSEPIVVRRQQQEKVVSFEHKDNAGAIFVNERKAAETHPDRTGTAMIAGRAYYIDGWLNKTKDGKTYLRLAFKPKDAALPKKSSDDQGPF
jgi:hypothetical protein